MIACDTSTLSAMLKGETGVDVDLAFETLKLGELALPPPVLTEALSNPETAHLADEALGGLPILETVEGYWRRAATTRGALIGKGLKARLADTLIAQSCLDANVPLITRDRDFRHFATHSGLKLAAPLR